MPRLRQVALVARELEPVAAELRETLRLAEPFRDPNIALFGLENVVFAIGDCFLEVVSPAQEGTTAGRYLERRGGDGGYMALFQVEDFAAARERVEAAGVRVVWEIDLGDIAGMHLHPRDVPGAIVSLDAADPPDSWRWAGPDWEVSPGGITALHVEVPDPGAARDRWAAVVGIDPGRLGVEFAAGDRGITEIGLTLPGREGSYEIGGVRITVA